MNVGLECSSFKPLPSFGTSSERPRCSQTLRSRPSPLVATLRCGKTEHICTATWFSAPHLLKGRISAARLCSSNGKYASPGASTTECELKGAVTAANETVVPRGKRAASLALGSLTEYIKGRRVEQGRPSALLVNQT